MNKVISTIESQPVRIIFYPLVTAVVLYLVSKGVMDSDTENWIIGIVAAAIGYPATAAAHKLATKPVIAATPIAAVPESTPES